MTSRASYQSGPSIFKKLVRLVARTFYSGPCPPRPEGAASKRKWERVDTTGLAIIILDHLAQQEWVKEENLNAELRIAPKVLVRALRYLEDERILRSESRKEGKRAQAKDIVVLVTKKEGTTSESQETDAPVKPLLQSYWAIDYPAFWSVLRLRLHLMRFQIKSEVEDTSSVADYLCPQCGNHYTTLDFASLLNRQTGQMICEECGTELHEESGVDGATGKLEDRQKRRDDMKAMLQKMDKELKTILELVQQAEDIKPPDYGCLADWAYEQTARKKAKEAQSTAICSKRGRGVEGDVTLDSAVSEKGSIHSASGAPHRENATQETPHWMRMSSRHEQKREVKRKLNDILPPPPEPIPATTPIIPAPLMPPIASPLIEKPKTDSASAAVAIDEDGIEWEEAGIQSEPREVEDMEWEDIPFDEEAARLADIESDLRTTSGWTTVQK